MNAEWPTARFEMEDQPQPPGYRNSFRSLVFLSPWGQSKMNPSVRVILSILTSIIAVVSMLEMPLRAEYPHLSASSERSIETHWELLGDQEPESTIALIELIKTPAKTIAFLERRLKPLELSSEDLHTRLGQLQSSDAFVWRAAYRELEYQDPRLALGLEELLKLDSMKQSPSRNRLASILIGFPLKSHRNVANRKFIKLLPVGDGGFNICCSDIPEACGASYWAESKIDQLGGTGGIRKPLWNRTIRAICLLGYFGTQEAFAIVKRVSEGHPDAHPTKFAKEVFARYQGAEH